MAKSTGNNKSAKKEVDIDAIREAATVNLVNALAPKVFKSGKDGFFAQGKIVVGETRYQAQLQIVEIAPKK